jgi:hypothetical protein
MSLGDTATDAYRRRAPYCARARVQKVARTINRVATMMDLRKQRQCFRGRALLSAALLVGLAVAPRTTAPAGAQTTAAPVSCSGTFTPSPMQGQYSGTWHSDGDYHFAVWNTDLRLQITIDGTLSMYVAPDGTVTGTANGSVDAPITHDGVHDVSSGKGSISGSIGGSLTASGANLVLHAPVIDMHWGTFVGGGYTVEKFITMPDYSFSVGSLLCTSSGGTISEQDFPTMAVVADGANQMTYAPGIGPATGTWSLTASKTSQFNALSSRVDAFISSANAVLDGPGSLTAGEVDRDIAAPLKALVADIRDDPDTARCLLERLAAWEATAVPGLLQRAALVSGSDALPSLRTDGDAVRAAQDLAVLCAPPEASAAGPVTAAVLASLDRAVAARAWTDVALLLREALLVGATPGPRLQSDLHSLLGATSNSTALLTFARTAYALGDDADTSAAYSRLTVRATRSIAQRKKKPHPKRKATPRPTAKAFRKPTPKPTATATPKPSSTPVPKPSLSQLLSAGIAPMNLTVSDGSAQWQAVPGATSYIVSVIGSAGVVWSWGGSATSTQLGETTLNGVPGSEEDLPPHIDATGAHWSVIALDSNGTIVGATFRKPV